MLVLLFWTQNCAPDTRNKIRDVSLHCLRNKAPMGILTDKLSAFAEERRTELKSLAKEHGDVQIGETKVSHVLGGMRGLPGLLCDTSTVSPQEGLKIRNIPINDLTNALPEDVFYLLLTGEMPDDAARAELVANFRSRSSVPYYVWNVLEAMPADTHPMVMLSTALMTMERESAFRAAYDAGTPKEQLWEHMLDDSFLLLSRITTIAAAIYRMRYNKGERIAPREDLDWGSNFAYMLGVDDPEGKFADLIKMYLVLHSDHGGGNVSAFTAHTVGSALSDIFYAFPAGLNGLAGPLHGLANQECLKFVISVRDEFNGVPTEQQMKEFTWNRLNNRQVIPGFGHAVLRVTDPRFTAFYDFGKANCADDEIFRTVEQLFKIVPGVLQEHGKATNPWPNVDAASGSLLHHYGLKEYTYYTVMFGVARALGISSQIVLNRALLSPIVRPKAMTTEALKGAIS